MCSGDETTGREVDSNTLKGSSIALDVDLAALTGGSEDQLASEVVLQKKAAWC